MAKAEASLPPEECILGRNSKKPWNYIENSYIE
jgi:hypothetical protein